jgi:hypothetical protein
MCRHGSYHAIGAYYWSRQAFLSVSPLILNGLCEQKFQVVRIFSPIYKNQSAVNWVYVKLWMEIIFANMIILIANKIVNVCFEQNRK